MFVLAQKLAVLMRLVAILVSGHDMRDLRLVLEATAGKNINVYTHGEMLPGNSYPELKKHKHFIGHYGTAWQNQKVLL